MAPPFTLPQRRLLHGIVTVAVIFAVLGCMTLVHRTPARFITEMAPAGVVATLFARFGRHVWREALAAVFIGGLIFGAPLSGAALGAVVSVGGGWLLAWLLERWRVQRDFSRRRDVVLFVTAASLAMSFTAFATWFGVEVVLAGGRTATASDAVRWWFNSTTIVMLLGPAVMGVSSAALRRWAQTGAAVSMLMAGLFCYTLLLMALPITTGFGWLPPLGALLVVFASITVDLSFSALLGAGVVAALFSRASSPEFSTVPAEGSLRLWAFACLVSGVTLVIRALLAEREAAAEAMRLADVQHQRRLLGVARREQERIGREMHDALGQELTGLALIMRTLERKIAARTPDLEAEAREASAACARALHATRVMAHGLMPGVHPHQDLREALAQLAWRVQSAAGIRVDVRIDGAARPASELSECLFRIAQEALTNSVRHSGASWIELRLERHGDRDEFSIEDNGTGFDAERPNVGGGLGLQGMRYRCALAGGTLHIDAAAGRGTVIRCEVPLNSDGPLATRSPTAA